jgi:hypothetical protein
MLSGQDHQPLLHIFSDSLALLLQVAFPHAAFWISDNFVADSLYDQPYSLIEGQLVFCFLVLSDHHVLHENINLNIRLLLRVLWVDNRCF